MQLLSADHVDRLLERTTSQGLDTHAEEAIPFVDGFSFPVQPASRGEIEVSVAETGREAARMATGDSMEAHLESG